MPVCNRFIPVNWIDLIKVVLEPGPQIQWTSYFREEAKNIGQMAKSRDRGIVLDLILGEGYYATLDWQCQ